MTAKKLESQFAGIAAMESQDGLEWTAIQKLAAEAAETLKSQRETITRWKQLYDASLVTITEVQGRSAELLAKLTAIESKLEEMKGGRRQ